MSRLSKSEEEDYKLNNLTRLVLYMAFIVIGAVLYNKTYIKLATVDKALGVSFIIAGAIYVWMCGREKKISLSDFDFIFGILAALSGLLLIINPGNLTNNLFLYFGIFIIICSLQKLVVAIKLFKAKDTAAPLTLGTSITLIILGFIVLFGPINIMSINKQCGVFAILYGIIQILIM